jgi:hypothetical protein
MLITTVAEIQSYLPVSVATSFETIQPFIESSERKFIKELLGYEAYTELVKYYAAVQSSGSYGSGQDEQAAYNELLKLVQKALINLAYYHGYAVLTVAASDGGFHRIESENHKGLYKYQEEELKDLFKKDGFNGLDDVLEYLEENIEYFPEFEDSDNRLVTKVNIIPDTKTFNAIYGIGSSRLVFLLLKRFMRQTEDFVIRKILGHTLFAEVKAEIVKPEPAEKIVSLLPYLQKPLAYFSVASGIDEMGVNVTDKMVYFESQQPTFFNSTVKTPATADQLAVIKDKAERTGNKYLEDLKMFLLDNATTYTEYSGQQGYIYKRDNSGKKTFFAG